MEQWTIWFMKNGRVNLFYNKHVYSCIRTIFTFVHTCIYLKDEEGNETGSEVKEDKSGMKYYTTVKSYLYPRGFMLCTLTRFFWQDVFIYKTVAFLKNHFFFTDSKLEKILDILKLIKMLLESLVDWMIEKFKRVSYNHRKVAETLEEEMKAQKALIQVSLISPSVSIIYCNRLPDTL